MPGYIRDGGAWKTIKGIYVRDAGVWKPVKSGFVRDAGAWKRFFSSMFATAINADSANVNLRTVANAAGYGGSGDCQITLNAEAWSPTGGPALVPGAWPAGITLTLIVAAGRFVTGTGGPAGRGGGNNESPLYAGQPGGGGGTALDASGVAGFTFAVQNLGTLRGGGGGGGGGGNNVVFQITDPETGQGNFIDYGGGGGGGGAGRNPGAGNRGGNTLDGLSGNGGANGSTAGGGGGGAGNGGSPQSTSAGGNGGGYGAAGQPGFAGLNAGNFEPAYAGGAGGPAGYAVTGNANIVWLATGTRLGPIA